MSEQERDPVQEQIDRTVFAFARRAYDYTPAWQRPERIAEELADEE